MTQAAGKLNHRVRLESLETSQDANGETVETWTHQGDVWANVSPVSGKEFISSAAMQSQIVARITVRYRSDIQATWRILFRNRYYNIEAVLADVVSGLEYLTLPCSLGVLVYQEPAPFDPGALFANGELGAWYDRAEVESMCQDSAGSIPITATIQPIGLAMDMRFGLVRGPELMANPDFTTNTVGYIAAGSATISHNPLGFASVNITGAGGGIAKNQTVSAVIGNTYEINIRVRSGTFVGSMNISAQGVTLATKALTPTFQDFKSIFVATGTNPAIFIARATAATGTVEVDNFSLKLLAGSHQKQATTTNRPLLRGTPNYAEFDQTDSLVTTFSTSLGSQCTVARAVPGVGASILTGQSIGTTFTDTVNSSYSLVINRALSPNETASLSAYLAMRTVDNNLPSPVLQDSYWAKPNGALVTADTGQTYVLQYSGDDKRLRIVNGQLTNIYSLALPNAGYAEVTLDNNVSRIGGSFRFGPKTTNNGAAVFVVWTEPFDPSGGGPAPDSPCHLVCGVTNWTYGVFNAGVLTNIISGTYSLLTDGTVYSADVQIIGSSAVILLPDGNRVGVTDSRISGNAGKIATFEVFALNAATDSRAGFITGYADDTPA